MIKVCRHFEIGIGMAAFGPKRRLLRDSITSEVGAKAEVTVDAGYVENDPQRYFATLNCRTAKGSLRPSRRRIAANIAKLPKFTEGLMRLAALNQASNLTISGHLVVR